jgi:DNA-binding IclR family transcriptional regulator
MPRSPHSDRGSSVIDRACDALKRCRHEWMAWGDIAEELGYAQRSNARRMLVTMYKHGLLEMRQIGPVNQYRVSPRWRDE